MRRSIFLAAMAVVFATYLNGLKLRQTDLWDHVNYGRFIIAANELPSTEPLLPFASDDSFVNPAWGSQVLMAACVDSESLGLAGIQTGHGMMVLLCITIIGLAVLKESESAVFAVLSSALYLYVNWQQFLVLRPQTIGLLFYTGLFVLLNQKQDRHRTGQAAILLTFVVWANLHGSFTMGLFLIGIVGIGRLLNLTIRIRRRLQVANTAAKKTHLCSKRAFFMRLLHRSGFNRLFILGLGCAVAALLNPYGIDVYEEIVRVGGHPNMQNMIEWRPLSLSMKQGRAAAFACMLLMAFAMTTRLRWQIQNVLLFLLLGMLMLWSSRMINWWAPVASYLVGIQAASVSRKLKLQSKTTPGKAPLRRSPILEGTVLFFSLMVIFFISPIGQKTISQSNAAQQSQTRQLLESRTPTAVASFLSETTQDTPLGHADLLRGIIFCPAEWTGFFMSATRQADTQSPTSVEALFPFRPLVNTHVHVIPPAVWNDFLRLHSGRPSSLSLLNRYQIDTVIIDRSRQRKLAERVETSQLFDMIYQDAAAQVWQRITK
ncbi:MAG: hypothetical protein ABJZ55_09465 [Fuerstiella sp.]